MDNFDADNWLRFRTHGPAAGNGVDDEGSGNDATTREVLAATNPWFSGSGGSSVPNPAQPHSGGSFLNSDAQVRALEGLDLNDGGAWSDVQRFTGILLPQDGDTSTESSLLIEHRRAAVLGRRGSDPAVAAQEAGAEVAPPKLPCPPFCLVRSGMQPRRGDGPEGAVRVYAPEPLSKTTTWTYWTTFLHRASWYCSPNLDSEMICSYQLLFACIHQHTSLLLWHASFRLGNTRLVGHRQIHVSSVRYGALKLIMATVSRES